MKDKDDNFKNKDYMSNKESLIGEEISIDEQKKINSEKISKQDLQNHFKYLTNKTDIDNEDIIEKDNPKYDKYVHRKNSYQYIYSQAVYPKKI